MLKIGCPTDVWFDVDVHGTKAEPLVKFVVVLPEHELSFKAQPENGRWKAVVNLPPTCEPGQCDIRVEVIINGRLFAPLKRRVDVGVSAVPSAEVVVSEPTVTLLTPPPAPESTKKEVIRLITPETAPVSQTNEAAPSPAPATPTQTPDQTRTWEGEGGALPETPEVPKPLPSEKPIVPVPAKPTVKESKREKQPQKALLVDITTESARRFDKVLKESKSYVSPINATKSLKIEHRVPITFERGEIIYE